MGRVDLEFTQFDNRAHFAETIYKAALGAGLEPAAAEILTAQAAHETNWGLGRHGKYPDDCRGMPNNNAFGIKVSPSWDEADKPWSTTMTEEREHGQMVPARARWRAWPTLEDGVRGAVDFLDQARYRKALAKLRAGDTSFFEALGRAGYYTGLVSEYVSSSMWRLRKIRSMLDVLRWQRALLADDPACLPKFGADGEVGSEVKAALRVYQARHGLPVTGLRDEATAAVLFS
jgi:peptidoglycan hydrolase-like protein with peptidoglycan-binding domain